MQPAYRVAPEPARPVVIVYRGLSMWAILFLSLMLVGMFGVAVALAASVADTVTLDMSRPTNDCTITRQYPVLGAFTEHHPLSSIRGTQLSVTTDKHGNRSYGVLLVTADGPVNLSTRRMSHMVRGAQKDQIDAFLSGTAPAFHMLYQQGSGLAVIWLLAGVFFLFLATLPWQRARITVDPAARMLLLERSRWPLRATAQSIPVGEIARVDMRSFRGSKGGRLYRVVLVLSSGQEVRLLRNASGAYGVHSRAAARIQAAIGLNSSAGLGG